MEYIQSLAIWLSMESLIESVMASSKGRRAAEQAYPSQPEEVFVPFHLPPMTPQPTVEAQPPVAVPGSEAMPVAA
jgi:hypothetical protein